MTHQYRKKPIVVQAIQWTGSNINDVWDLLGAAEVYGPTEANPTSLLIDTLEGQMRAEVNDWLIKGVAGEIYPCKPEIFTATYERVEAGAST